MNVTQRITEETSQKEEARRATGVCDVGSMARVIPDPEVPEQKARRRFTAEYKLRVLREVDA
ncbi:MAG: hypothetical protein ABIE74_08795, partial [Pseudomonadota bacterium]